MPAFTHHLFVCCNQRAPGHPRGCCDPKGSEALRNAFKAEIKKRGLGSLVRANMADCLDQCEHGPNVVIYPLRNQRAPLVRIAQPIDQADFQYDRAD